VFYPREEGDPQTLLRIKSATQNVLSRYLIHRVHFDTADPYDELNAAFETRTPSLRRELNLSSLVIRACDIEPPSVLPPEPAQGGDAPVRA
jgi:hypothetical protein